MLNYLHDIRNKIAIISGHTNLLSKKYSAEDFMPIKTNLCRINELVNEAYQKLQEPRLAPTEPLSFKEFVRKLDLLADAFVYSFPIQIINQISLFNSPSEGVIHFNINLLAQVLENAIDNSIKANSSKLIIRLYKEEHHCVLELIDNGNGITPIAMTGNEASTIPHGLGKKIMKENMHQINGKVEWSPRTDSSGMMVRLFFPMPLEP